MSEMAAEEAQQRMREQCRLSSEAMAALMASIQEMNLAALKGTQQAAYEHTLKELCGPMGRL